MSKVHKTWVGKEIATVALFFHNIFPQGHPVTAQDIIGLAEDTAATVNVVRGIAADLKGLTDPAQIADALAVSIEKHLPEVPAVFKTPEAEQELINVCHQTLGLDLPVIEAALKVALAKKG